MYAFDISRMVRCYQFGRMKQKNGWERTDIHSIAKNLFVFLIDGQADFYVDGADYTLQAGDVLIIPARTPYRAFTEDFCEYYFYHFDGQIKQVDPPTLPPVPLRFSFHLPEHRDSHIYFSAFTATESKSRHIYNSIIACTEHHARGTHTGQKLLECEFLKILLRLAEITERAQQDHPLPSTLNRIIIHIKKSLTQPLGLDEICEAVGISPSYASRLFKQYMNTTVTEYINSEKLYYACELMTETSMNLTEIADYLGYCDVSYFSKRFKRKFGKAPSVMFSYLRKD